jgi:hypothetical protein
MSRNRVIYILIIIITLIELYWGYNVYINYRGVYDIAFFSIFILQPIWYIWLLKKEKSQSRFGMVVLVLLSVILPIIIYFTLPNYTYDYGKDIIKEYFNEKIEFVNYSRDMDTIPVSNKPKNLFTRDRAYYYKIKLGNKYKYFIVNEQTGNSLELEEGYWE